MTALTRALPNPAATSEVAAVAAFGVLIAAVASAAALPGLIFSSLDPAIFSLVGGRLTVGDLPYADIWDHKPPGIYLVNAVSELAAGAVGGAASWPASWTVSVLSVIATALVVRDLLWRLGWGRLAWLTGGLLALELASFPLARGGGMTETLAALPAALAIRQLVLRPVDRGSALLAGAWAGVATLISMQAVPVIGAVLVTVALRARHDRALHAAAALAGVVACLAALVLALVGSGLVPDAIGAVIGYNAAYGALAVFDDPVGFEAIHAALLLSLLGVPALIGAIPSLRLDLLRPLTCGALAWIGGAVILIALQGRMELHYAALLVIPLALLAPAGFQVASEIRDRRNVIASTALALLAAATVISGTLIVAETAVAFRVRSAQAAHVEQVAGWIDAHSAADEQLFVWGDAPQVYAAAGRDPASVYVYMLPLMTPGYVTPEMIGRVLAGWQAQPPALIIDAGSSAPGQPGLPPLLVARQVISGDGRTADLLDPLRAFVAERYRLAATVDGWPIYSLR